MLSVQMDSCVAVGPARDLSLVIPESCCSILTRRNCGDEAVRQH
jgi:hypothetical protein